jgi:hypothetical protein
VFKIAAMRRRAAAPRVVIDRGLKAALEAGMPMERNPTIRTRP